MKPVARVYSFPALTLALALTAGTLAGCVAAQNEPALLSALQPPAHAPQTANEALQNGRALYAKGLYGSAETQFRAGIEKEHKNAELWLGLAACYDQLRRFDLADKAYGEVRRLYGVSPEILNNEAYSQQLRGNFKQARVLYQKAHKLDPGNDTIAHNLRELNTAQSAQLPGRR